MRKGELSIAEARALAERREAQRKGMQEDYEEQRALDGRFSDASELAVVDMWERGTNEHGKPLTKFEVRALVERWCLLFGCFPPSVASEPNSAAPAEAADDLERRADDDLMTRKEVADKLHLHVTTIQRLEQSGRLPKPGRLGARGRRHRVADIRAFIESLGDNRR
jgi:predicted DNA-binding transcriptional regulator AlpA